MMIRRHVAALSAMSALMVALTVATGCSKKSEEKTPEPEAETPVVEAETPVVEVVKEAAPEEPMLEPIEDLVMDREANQEYQAALKKIEVAQRVALRDVSKARQAVEKAVREGADAAELTRLSNVWIKASNDFAVQRQVAGLTIGTEQNRQLEHNRKAAEQRKAAEERRKAAEAQQAQ